VVHRCCTAEHVNDKIEREELMEMTRQDKVSYRVLRDNEWQPFRQPTQTGELVPCHRCWSLYRFRNHSTESCKMLLERNIRKATLSNIVTVAGGQAINTF